MGWLDPFDQVWCADFEYQSLPGERPHPWCLVAREFKTGRTIRMWEDELVARSEAPFPVGPSSLLVAYFSTAELRCFRALGWPLPHRILDLCVEFKCLTSGLTVACGRGLLGALAAHGIDGLNAIEKAEMQQLAIRGGPFTAGERQELLDYCETDVVALTKLLPAMLLQVDFPRAVLRGRYMVAVSLMEWLGVPIDVATLATLRHYWPAIQEKLISRVDQAYGVYEGRVFKRDRFGALLAKRHIPWPRLESGELDLDDDTFREMAKLYPELSPLRELRHALSNLRLEKLEVGRDDRNRCMLSSSDTGLSPFGSKTGRNQPSNSKFIMGSSVWLRGLIKPSLGIALAYLDYEQQEFGIAAALSGDILMMDAYRSGDPYLAFAKQAGAAPVDATTQSHPSVRNLYKLCGLAVQYAMGARSLAERIGQPEIVARELLRKHRETYRRFWEWSDAVVSYAMIHGKLWTVFGWCLFVDSSTRPTTLRNFLMQSNASEMLRVAICLGTERGIRVVAPVHDAVLIEAPVGEIGAAISIMQEAMAEASEIVLGGFRLRISVDQLVRYPERFMDEKRGRQMWNTVMAIVDELETAEKGAELGDTAQLSPLPAS